MVNQSYVFRVYSNLHTLFIVIQSYNTDTSLLRLVDWLFIEII